MKNSIFVLAMALILVVAFAGESISRGTPEGYRDPAYQDGDDHTWGGETENSSGGGIVSSTSTGYIPIDLLIRTFSERSFRSVIIIGIIGMPTSDVTDVHQESTTPIIRGN